MITTMRGSIVSAMPMTDAQFGLLTSVFGWVYGLLSPFAGFLADRFNRSRVIIGSLLVWSLVTWLTAHAKTFEQLLAARALMGISEACYIPAALALIADYHRGSTRSLATGIHMTGIMVGSGAAGIGGWIAERYHWTNAFVVFGIVGLFYAVALLAVLRDPPAERNASDDSVKPKEVVRFTDAIRHVFGRGSFWLLLSFWGFLGIVGWVVSGWLPTYFQEHFHLSQGRAGFYALSYMNVAAFVGVLCGGYWADRWSRTNPRARMWVPAIGLCVAAPGIFLLANTTQLSLAIVGCVIYAFARYFTDSNVMPILCLITDPRYRATGYGVLNFFSSIVGGLGVYAGGALRDAHINLSRIFIFAAATMFLCAFLLILIRLGPEAKREETSR